jgi:hypothetical protein
MCALLYVFFLIKNNKQCVIIQVKFIRTVYRFNHIILFIFATTGDLSIDFRTVRRYGEGKRESHPNQQVTDIRRLDGKERLCPSINFITDQSAGIELSIFPSNNLSGSPIYSEHIKRINMINSKNRELFQTTSSLTLSLISPHL